MQKRLGNDVNTVLALKRRLVSFYCATECNATHRLAVEILSIRLSVCQMRLL